LNVFSANEASGPRLAFGEDAFGSGLPASRSSPETLRFDANLSPPPMSGFGRFSGSSASSLRGSRPNSEDLDALLMQHKSGFVAFNPSTPR
jgi:hypothetical protein